VKRYIIFRNSKNSFSLLLEKKTIWSILFLVLCILFLFIAGVGLGDVIISPSEAIRVFLGSGIAEHELIIDTLRLPRIVVSILVGMALAVSGCILQGIIRNPLASPDIVGITGGASVAAVAFITYLSGDVSIKWLPLATIIGAGLTSLIIYFLSWNKGVTPIRLVMIGIGMAATLSALTTFMIVLSPIYSASQAYIWLTGSIYGANWENVITLLPWVVVFIPLAFIYSRDINVQGLGDDVATGLGSPVQRKRFILLMISVALAGSAVAIAGGIGFVGLIAPHIARMMIGNTFGGLLPLSALVGGILVLLADLIGRTLFIPLDVPAGVFTAGIGAPFFIYLLYRNRNK
jgi:iron complex transport system permease protein